MSSMEASASSNGVSSQEEPPEPKVSVPLVLCDVCTKRVARYKCPGCHQRTCSLPCILRHKKEKACRGERVKTAYIAVKDFTDADLRSDLHFLEASARKAELAKKDRSKQDRNSPFRRRTFISHAKQRGVELMLMPNGMSRHKANNSMFHFGSNTLHWRVEWSFPEETLTLVDTGFSDVGLVEDGVESALHRHFAPTPTPTLPPSLPAHSKPLASNGLNHEADTPGLVKVKVEPLSDTEPERDESQQATSEPLAAASLVSGPETMAAGGMVMSADESELCRSGGDNSVNVSNTKPTEMGAERTELCRSGGDNSVNVSNTKPTEMDAEGAEVCQPGGDNSNTSDSAPAEGMEIGAEGTGLGLPAGKDSGTASAGETAPSAINVKPMSLSDVSPALQGFTAEGGRCYRVFLRVPGLEANRERYYELDKKESLQKNLQGKRVIEFPTLFIVAADSSEKYSPMTADEERQLKSTPLHTSSFVPYHGRQQNRSRGNRGRRRPPHRQRYTDADAYNPDSSIFKP